MARARSAPRLVEARAEPTVPRKCGGRLSCLPPNFMKVRVEEDPKYGLVHKVGTLTLDFGVRGSELERELLTSMEKFIKAMELRGLMLYKPPGGKINLPDHGVVSNPFWVENPDGEKAAFYAIDWEGKHPAKQSRVTTGELIDLPREKATTLEASFGEVEYRVIGLFWAPEKTVEILTSVQERKDAEKASRNPVSFDINTPFNSSQQDNDRWRMKE